MLSGDAVQIDHFSISKCSKSTPVFRRNPNHVLLRCFLRSAAAILRPDGQIAISVIDSPHYDGAFAMAEAARWAGICEPTVHPFDMADHPGYQHVNTQGDEASAVDAGDQLQTYVFGPRC